MSFAEPAPHVSAHPAARPPAAMAAIGVILAFSAIAAMLNAEGWLIATSGAVLIAIILMLWRGDDPPILLLPALFQWSEVAIVPLSTIWTGIPYQDLSTYGADLRLSGLYGLLGVLALSVGFWVTSGKTRGPSMIARMREETQRWTFSQVLYLAGAMIAAGYVLSGLMWRSGGFAQVLGAASEIKSAGLFILTFWVLTRGTGHSIWAAIVAVDVAFGMTGFFAEFKNSILSVLIAAIAAKPRLRAGDMLSVAAAVALLLSVAIFWSAVKADYRSFVNQGTGAQVVSVPLADRVDYLSDQVLTFDGAKAADGFDRLVRRHGYIEFLGLVMGSVPQVVPHENGKLTVAVLRHISIPRFLWPQKPVLPSDTEVMARYANLEMTWDGNTSISIGYLGELYIDFGYLGGLLAAGALGLIVGGAYRYVRDQRRTSALVAAGLALMVVLPIAYFGTAYIKMVGSFVMTSVVVALMLLVVAPSVLPHFARYQANLSGDANHAPLRRRRI